MFGQPAPCMGQGVIIIDGFSNVNQENVQVSIGQITYRDQKFLNGSIKSPVWTDCVDNEGVNSENLSLNPVRMFNCGIQNYQSKSSDKYYLIGYSTNDAVLTVKWRSQVMYLVLPNGNSNKVNQYFITQIYEEIHQNNFKKDREFFYAPDVHLPEIPFREGVFFLEDYNFLDKTKNVKQFPSKKVVEFYNSEKGSRVFPLEYWKDTVTFFSPYNSPKGLVYSNEFAGKYTEGEAIKLIVENGSNYTQSIYDYFHWEKYIKNHDNTEADIALMTFLSEAKSVQDLEIKNLLTSFEENKLSVEELYESYEILKKEDALLVLENDFRLMNLFCNYLSISKTNINDFMSFFEDGTYKINSDQLTLFLKQKFEK